jgi:predicted polyphosphate/ATP-dependent NAD kinase
VQFRETATLGLHDVTPADRRGLFTYRPLSVAVHVGVVVNPIAGMGGRVGLKGTDGKIEAARERGARPRAPARARRALETLHETAPSTTVHTWGDPMGEEEARAAGFDPIVRGRSAAERTTAADTRAAVRAFLGARPDTEFDPVELVVFVGGDGTAADVAAAHAAAGRPPIPVLGVPAGVKVYSSVFAVSPVAAGEAAAGFDRIDEREVLDVDESAYRAGDASPSLEGVLPVPVVDGLQGAKRPGGGSVDGIAAGVAADARPGVTYVLGPGGTLAAVKEAMGVDGTPLGVDVVRDGSILVEDGSARAIVDALGDRNVVVVTPIGGQGFVLGRGNQQISPAVVRRSRLAIVTSGAKLDDLDALRVDTGDPELDERLRGWHRVRTGRVGSRLVRIV